MDGEGQAMEFCPQKLHRDLEVELIFGQQQRFAVDVDVVAVGPLHQSAQLVRHRRERRLLAHHGLLYFARKGTNVASPVSGRIYVGEVRSNQLVAECALVESALQSSH